jgi:hypothetical protein
MLRVCFHSGSASALLNRLVAARSRGYSARLPVARRCWGPSRRVRRLCAPKPTASRYCPSPYSFSICWFQARQLPPPSSRRLRLIVEWTPSPAPTSTSPRSATAPTREVIDLPPGTRPTSTRQARKESVASARCSFSIATSMRFVPVGPRRHRTRRCGSIAVPPHTRERCALPVTAGASSHRQTAPARPPRAEVADDPDSSCAEVAGCEDADALLELRA